MEMMSNFDEINALKDTRIMNIVDSTVWLPSAR